MMQDESGWDGSLAVAWIVFFGEGPAGALSCSYLTVPHYTLGT